MAWEISHTPQAWANVRARLMREWSNEELAEALVSDDKDPPHLVEEKQGQLEEWAHDTLVDSVLQMIEENNTCSTGGHEFWIDKDGYHTVSCSAPDRGTCGRCKCEVELVREIPERGMVELDCGCTEDEAVWSAEE